MAESQWGECFITEGMVNSTKFHKTAPIFLDAQSSYVIH